MSELVHLAGLDGGTPLGFMAALGLLKVVTRQDACATDGPATLEWYRSGPRVATLKCGLHLPGVVQAVIDDRQAAVVQRVLTLSYPKIENDAKTKGKAAKPFLGLRPPVGVLRAWLTQWIQAGDWEAISTLAGLMTETATEAIKAESCPRIDQVGELAVDTTRSDALTRSAAPTPFDFTSRNQQFLDQARLIAGSLHAAEIEAELIGKSHGVVADRTMGWDMREDRPGALFSATPSRRLPVLEWLAFRALSLFPLLGTGEMGLAPSCQGRRKQGRFRWCLWDVPVSLRAFQALSRSVWPATRSIESRCSLGVVEVFESELAKGADGYSGVFQPVSVV